MRHVLFVSVIIFLLLSTSCSNVSIRTDRENLENKLQELTDEAMDDSSGSIAGVSIAVVADDISLAWQGSSGFLGNKKAIELDANNPFRIASITKTYVATAILRLHEMGKLSIDKPLHLYISKNHSDLLTENGYSTDSITLRHCLQHTSGLFDYAMGGGTYAELILTNTNKRWTRTEQLELAMNSGIRTGYPGEKYSYGDTGYILAGEAIEIAMDTTLSASLRVLLKFDELGMDNTWLESLEAAPSSHKPFVKRYFRGRDVTEVDPSVDLYGGGGLVSSSHDLAIFINALFRGKIYDSNETLELMLKKPVYASSYDPTKNKRHKDYRMGLWEIDLFGEKAYMHSGLWGTHHLYLPEHKIAVATNYTFGMRDRLLKKAILAVKNVTNKQN